MTGSISYRSGYEPSGSYKQIVVTEISIDTLKCTGREPGGGPGYIIDLSTYSGNFTYPKIGDYWIITKLGQTWVLDRRCAFQNRVYTEVDTTQPGQTVIDSARFVGNVTFDADVVFTGPVAPAGVMEMYGGATAPAGYLLCDGAEISRVLYANLFTAIGTAYGVGNGTTTFNLPDFSLFGGRFPRMSTPGTTGGSTTHTHTFNDGGHTHSVPGVAHTHDLGANGGAAAITYNASHPAIRMRRVNTTSAYTANIMENTGNTLAIASSDSTSVSLGASLIGDTDSTTPASTTSGMGTASGTTGGTSTLPVWVGVTMIIKT